MTQDDVIEVLGLAERLGLSFWVDGGWAVDAVLGRQTRVHDDLDILIQRRDELVLVSAFRDAGFGPIGRDDTTTWNYILGDARGREIDFHVIEPGDSGVWHYGPAGGPPREVIPEQDLTGHGQIGGLPIRCVTPAAQVRFHTGYFADAKDWADVSALCERFGIAVPPDYDTFTFPTSGI